MLWYFYPVFILKDLPPKFVFKGHPNSFKTTLDRDRYIATEIDRWHDGYAGLSGIHYFYLTQGTLVDLDLGLIRPDWRDVDEFIFENYNECTSTSEDLLIFKRREVGLTSIAGCIMAHLAYTKAESKSLVTSADVDRLQAIFNDKLHPFLDNIHPLFKQNKGLSKDNKYIKLAERDNVKKTFEGLNSEIIGRQTSKEPKDAKAFESSRAIFGFLDEIFLHPRPMEVRDSMQACFKKQMVKIGTLMMGGSTNIDEINKTHRGKIDDKRFDTIWGDCEALHIRKIFLPAWMGLYMGSEMDDNGRPTGKRIEIGKNGHSNEKLGTEYIEKERERLSKAKNKRSLISFIKSYPLSVQEVLSTSKHTILEEHIADSLRERKIFLDSTPPPIQRYILNEDASGKVHLTQNNDGYLYILERPIIGEDYIAGTDPIPFGDADESIGSDFCTVIKRVNTNRYVAILKQRSMDARSMCYKNWLFQKLYNNAETLVERNRAAVLIEIYKEKGWEHFLSKEPSKLWVRTRNRVRGFNKSGDSANIAVNALLNKLYDNAFIQSLDFPEMVDDLLGFGVSNTDIADAMVGCELNYEEVIKAKSHIETAKEKKKISVIEMGANGKTIRKVIEVYV